MTELVRVAPIRGASEPPKDVEVVAHRHLAEFRPWLSVARAQLWLNRGARLATMLRALRSAALR